MIYNCLTLTTDHKLKLFRLQKISKFHKVSYLANSTILTKIESLLTPAIVCYLFEVAEFCLAMLIRTS